MSVTSVTPSTLPPTAPSSSSRNHFRQPLKPKLSAGTTPPARSATGTSAVSSEQASAQHYQQPDNIKHKADWFESSDSDSAPYPSWLTPHTPDTLNPYQSWRDVQQHSPLSSHSVTSTPSMVDTTSTSSNIGLPMTPQPAPTLLPVGPVDKSPVSPPAVLQPYGLSVFTNMNGQLVVPGVTDVASHEGDGSLNLNGLTGDGSNGGGYDAGFGVGDSGGFGGDDHFGHNGNDGFGGNDGGDGPPDDGGDPGDGGPPPPPPKGKKLALACHFCRRRKLKCDGIRPECENCSKRGEKCSYDDNVRRRGPGKRTKEMRQRSGKDPLRGDVDSAYASFALDDPTQPISGPSQPPRAIAPALDPSQSQHTQPFDETSIPSSTLPEIDPNIDPALAILGMGIDPPQDDVGPATLAEAAPARGQKRKSGLASDAADKRSKLEDETYEATMPDHHSGIGVGVGVGVGVGSGSGVGVGADVGVSGLEVPDFSAWGTGEGREGEVDEDDLAKFENDLRRVIQDQAEAEAKALDQEQAQGQ